MVDSSGPGRSAMLEPAGDKPASLRYRFPYMGNGGTPKSPIVGGLIGPWHSTPGVEFHRSMKAFPWLVP